MQKVDLAGNTPAGSCQHLHHTMQPKHFFMSQKGDGDVCPSCRSRTIDDKYTLAYAELFQSKQKKQDANNVATEKADDLQSQHNITIATMLEENRKKKHRQNTGNYSTPSNSIVSYLSPQSATTPSDLSRNSTG